MEIRRGKNISAAIGSILLYGSISIFCFGIAIFFGGSLFKNSNDRNNSAEDSKSNSLESIENLKSLAESKTRNDWHFSDYAKERMPVEMAGGEWSSSQNIWNCNVKEFICIEVDFKIPDHALKASWLLSYDKETLTYYATRPLTEAATNLFEPAPASREEVDKLAQALKDSSQSTHREEVSPLPGELIKFVQRNYQMSPELTAIYKIDPPRNGGEWFETPSNDYQQKDVCKSQEAKCYTVYYSDVKNQIACYWIVAIFRSENTQRVYPSDGARKWFLSNESSINMEPK